MKLSIIVPCYNEEGNLRTFHASLREVTDSLGAETEVLYINDGSKDRTLEILKEITASDPEAYYMSFSRNFGKEAAIYAGICNVTGDYAAVMDADLQDPPGMLKDMYEILQKGEYDCVAARREDRKGEPPVRSWFARMFYRIINVISDVKIPEGSRDFRMMSRQMYEAVAAMQEANRFSKGLFEWVGFRTKYIPYDNRERQEGASKWSFGKTFPLRHRGNHRLFGSTAELCFLVWYYHDYGGVCDASVHNYP